jgi:biotin operon repressor
MDTATDRLIERVGQRYEARGLPRTAGRIAAFLLLAEKPCSQEVLAEALHVSRASVSTNARLLERSGIIERVTRAGERRDFYRIPDDFYERVLDQWLEGLRGMHSLLERSLAEGVGGGTPAVRRRLERLAEFHEHLVEEIEGVGERWIRDHARRSASGPLAGSGAQERDR